MKLTRIAALVGFFTLAAASQALVWNISSNLTGGQEVPPNNSTATGMMTGTYDDVTNVLTVTMFNLNGMSAALTGSHIHVGAPGVNGGVIVNIPHTTSWMNMGSGNYMYQGTSLTVPAANETAFLSGGTYFNIHTSNFLGGEIRGLIRAAPVPEPATFAAVAFGLALLRRRRSR